MNPRPGQQPQKQVVFGIHAVAEALQAGTSIDKIFLEQGRNMHHRINEIRSLANHASIPLQYVPEVKLRKLSKDGNHQGVVALVSPIPYRSLDELMLTLHEQQASPLLLMLDGVTDVRNFGAIARTALCMGAHGIIIPTRGSAAVQADAIKTSAGALLHLPVCRVHNLTDAYYIMQTYGIRAVACTEKASASLFETDLRGPLCLILGSEEKGISSQLLKRVDQHARIPLQGPVSSLNVSVAAGMALMEVSRQRSMPQPES
ncbi:MAG: 23S rRNA (guanosine(2251)-2'-O)-methyltransferase RlmB [Bacteroidetes bacterium]|nr:MAG: 23S rRNA (guanosine(2251)-2'-O)-methyltransferase RlmB [Bacteroidota bacterium]